MKKTVVVYKSKYGNTKKYAEWIAEELKCDLIEATNAKLSKLMQYDTIIYGGSLFASGIYGAEPCISKNFQKLKNKNLIVFTVGLGKTDDISVFEPIKKHNFTDTMIENIKFFHLRGGIDYKKLSFMHKLMMSMMKKMIEKKSEKNAEDEQFLKTYGQSVDFTDKSTIEPLVSYIKSID